MGNLQQQAAFTVLKTQRIFSLLSPYRPILAGTYPLGIMLPSSDLDICLEVYDAERFESRIRFLFASQEDFLFHRTEKHGIPTAIVRWRTQNFPVELFAQPLPVLQHRAVRHLLVEFLFLQLCPALSPIIVDLKKRGFSTEQAFCTALKITEPPYQFLYDLSYKTVHHIRQIAKRFSDDTGTQHTEILW